VTHRTLRRACGLTTVVALGLLASACTSNNTDDPQQTDDRSVAVTSTDTECKVSATEAPAGTLTFKVKNAGTEATEFYLLAEDGQRIVGEVENIGPGLTRNLVVSAPEGHYITACKPGMEGKGIHADFRVNASNAQEGASIKTDDALVTQATAGYAAYVREQTEQLLEKTEKFATHYEAGKDDAARALYPRARQHWERIETVAESFGDLDPKMDAREADLEPGQEWTGWHRIEKDLWPPARYEQLSAKQRSTYARDLLDNTRTLEQRIERLDFSLDQIANGSRGLLEEVATGKITGEEETWSHTDLWDFQANVDGARVGYVGVRPLLVKKDKELATSLDRRFAELQELLDSHRTGDGFTSYDELSAAQVKKLADGVNALSEPLSRLTAAVVG
jgi:iron uptake system component EfeO